MGLGGAPKGPFTAKASPAAKEGQAEDLAAVEGGLGAVPTGFGGPCALEKVVDEDEEYG